MVDEGSRILAGRYAVGELIGRGGMAEVHIGHDTRLGRTVAIKVLRSDLARDPSFLARFRREAQAAASLNHPAIVAVYDTGEDLVTEASGVVAHVPFIVMEYVEGHTVRDILRDGNAVPIDEAVEITAGVLSALEYSHHAGIVHRDIKPANVMLTPTGAIKVMDFGIARAVADSAATMTQTQAVIGTAQYLSPEQAQGQPVDARSDLYSTGCMLFELLTRRPPFIGDTPVSIAYQHVGEAPQPPSAYQPDLSADLDAVVLHSLVKDRDARYQDAAQFRLDLSAARTGMPISSAAHGTAAGAALTQGARSGAAAMGGDPTMAMRPADATQVVEAPVGRPHNTATLPAIGRDPAEVPPKRHWATYVLLAFAVVVALALLGLAGKAVFTANNEAPKVTVPTVLNLTQAQAEAKLRSAGFDPVATKAANPAAEGKVIDQSPQAGEKFPANTKVTITVSSGPGQTVVPDVAGQSADSAKVTLAALGLTVGSVQTVDDPSLDKGKVIATVPAAGATVTAGSAVVLKVASGKVKVPDEVGADRGAAQQALSDLKLKTKTTFKDSADKPEGTVLSQTHVGEMVDAGTVIDLVVAQTPQPTTPPTTTPPPTTPPTTTVP